MVDEDLSDLPAAPPGLADNLASEPEIVRWVARNIDRLHPDPSKCPDPFAWTLLRQCRGDKQFTIWFVDKLWSKLIPSRAQLESTGGGQLDGKPQLDLIEKIERMRDEAVEEFDPSVPGFRSPISGEFVPDEVPDAFEDYDPSEDDE